MNPSLILYYKMKQLDTRAKQDIYDVLEKIAKEKHILDVGTTVDDFLDAMGLIYDIPPQQKKEFYDFYNERQVAYVNES